MANIGRRETLVNCMNSIASVSDISLGFVNGMMFTSEACHDRHSRTVKAEMWHCDAAKELKPGFRWILGQQDERRAFFLDRLFNELAQVVVQRGTVDFASFTAEGNCSSFQVYIAQRDCGFRNAASLTHGDQPTVTHPTLLVDKGSFDCPLLGESNFRLLLGRSPSHSQTHGWISGHVAAFDG